MTVSINMPRERRSGLEDLAAAVSIAKNIYGIKSDIDEKSLRQKALAQRSEEEKLAREALADKNKRIESGELTRADALELAKSGVNFMPPGSKDALGGFSIPGQGGQRQEIAIGRKGSAMDELNRSLKLSQYALAQERDQRQADKIKNDVVRKAAESIEKSGAPELMASLKKLDDKIPGGIDGDGDIPGIGGLANLAGNPGIGPLVEQTISDEGKQIRQLVANVRNSILKARSGGAVTPQEADRVLEELGQGILRTNEQLRAGLVNIRDSLRTRVQAIEAGFPEDALAEYRSRKGAITSEDPLFVRSAGPAPAVGSPLEATATPNNQVMPTREDALQELRRRGLLAPSFGGR